MENQELAKKRKEKIKNWLKDRHNLIFVIILIFAVIIRLYYFNLTKTQPIWWDESDYLAYAKNIAGFQSNWIITSQHNSLYPYFAAMFFMLGFGEVLTKFFLQLIPSVIAILLVYLICAEMYEDKRIALVASFLMAVLWEHLFNTMRFHIDILALSFGLLAIYIFWKGYEKKEKIFEKINPRWTIPLTVFFAILTYAIRRGYFLFGVFFLIYILLVYNWKSLLKDKYNWIALGFAGILLFISEKFIFISRIEAVSGTYFHPENKINLLPLDVFSAYFSSSINQMPSTLLYLYWLGFAILIINILLSFDYLKKLTKNTNRADLFNILTIAITLAFFIFVIRTPDIFGEGRWYFPLALGAFVCISRSALFIADFVKKYSKYASFIMLLLLIGIGGYYEIKQADAVIKNKEASFEGIKQASLYLKEISATDDLIVSVAVPQVVYYAERDVIQPDGLAGWTGGGEELPIEDFMQAVRNNPKAKYLLVSFSQTGHPPWMTKVYGNNDGQIIGWEIEFMETKIDFANQKQDVKQSKAYEGIIFNLLEIKQDVFIYEIKRENDMVA